MTNYISYRELQDFIGENEDLRVEIAELYQPFVGSLFYDRMAFESAWQDDKNGLRCAFFEKELKQIKHDIGRGYLLPALNSGDLINLIERKTGCKVDLEYYNTDGYDIWLKPKYDKFILCEDKGHDLTLSLWSVFKEVFSNELY